MTRFRIVAIAAALLAALASFGAAAADKPVLRAHVVIDDGLVTLGDLFENAGDAAETAVFRAPDPGEVGSVSAVRIEDAARRHGLEWPGENAIRSVTVTRTSTEVSLDEIKSEIAAAVRTRLGLPGSAELAMELDPRARPLHLSSQVSAAVDVTRLDLNRETGAFAAEIRASDRAAAATSAVYRGRAVETITVPVLTAPVTRGEEIRASDVTMRGVPRNGVTPGTIVHRDGVVGMAARRSLNPGETLREADVEAPKLVTRNASVQLVYKSASMTISTLGRALDDGAHGEAVRILNLRSKRIVDATVTGRNTATVTPMISEKTALLGADAN